MGTILPDVGELAQEVNNHHALAKNGHSNVASIDYCG
jgi:hypothetical protein